MQQHMKRFPISCSRRCFLNHGSTALAGFGLADVLRLRAEAALASQPSADTSVIVMWLGGGASQFETYDMKPDAPTEYRGEFRPIGTNVPGIEVCELLPRHAQVADRFALIRSISHEFAEHETGVRRFMTGRIQKSFTSFSDDYPSVGAIVAKLRENDFRGLPPFISSQYFGDATKGMLSPAYLGPAYAPFLIPEDPSHPSFKVQNLDVPDDRVQRIEDRHALLQHIDRLERTVDRSGSMDALDKFSQQAFNLLTNNQARQAFDLSREDPKLRERYGHHAWGQKSLISRRLVEAGCSFVFLQMDTPTPRWDASKYQPGQFWNWDSHAVNCHLFNDARFRLPYLDQAVSTLIEDLYERGLDKKVMLVVTGEFGRSPQLENTMGIRSGVLQPGRGHWAKAMTVLVSGGGMRMGQVIGATNKRGEEPKDRPLTPNDLWATVYRHLGIDYTKSFLDHSGRPMPILPFGEPIHELI
jgi:hypothetical protein